VVKKYYLVTIVTHPTSSIINEIQIKNNGKVHKVLKEKCTK